MKRKNTTGQLPKGINLSSFESIVLKLILDDLYDIPESNRSKNETWRLFKSYVKSKGNWKDRNRGHNKPEQTLSTVNLNPPLLSDVDPDEIW
jgi:hypothetical protein